MNRKAAKRKGWSAHSAVPLVAVALGLVVSVVGWAAPAESAERSHTITIGVSNYAKVSRWVLAEAEKQAKAVLHETGVETTWLDCPLAEWRPDPGPRTERTDVYLTIVRNVMKERRPSMPDTLGFALPCQPGGSACMAYIFYGRVETESANGYAAASVILGHVMAHELGHLLLGPAHSQRGIMRARWNRGDLELASRRQLSFMPAQVEPLRAAAVALRE